MYKSDFSAGDCNHNQGRQCRAYIYALAKGSKLCAGVGRLFLNPESNRQGGSEK